MGDITPHVFTEMFKTSLSTIIRNNFISNSTQPGHRRNIGHRYINTPNKHDRSLSWVSMSTLNTVTSRVVSTINPS